MGVPLGSQINLGIQIISLAVILVGLRFAIRTHNAYRQGKDEGPKLESRHKNLMTSAVIISGIGVIIWMVPAYFLGWNYGTTGLDYGTGGYSTWYTYLGLTNPHWYLMVFMPVVGALTAILGVYLVLRMRWSRFPERLKIQNYRAVMITTWTLWLLNIVVGFAVYYYFAYLMTG